MPRKTTSKASLVAGVAAVFGGVVVSRPANAQQQPEQAIDEGEAVAAPRREPVPTQIEPIPVSGRVEVHFLGYRGEDRYTVTVARRACTTPCTLMLLPGATTMNTTGAGEFAAQFVVPHRASQVRIAHTAPGWYMSGGTVLLPTGILVGSSFWAFGLLCGYYSPGCSALNFVGWPVLGISMIVLGSVLLGMGGRTPPADANRAEILDASYRPRVRVTDVAFAPTDRGATAALTLSF